MIDLAKPEEGGADGRLAKVLFPIPSRLCEQVARDVFADELVIRHVVVEGANQVVAVTPGVMDFVVPFVAVRLGKPDHIQPVSRPAFAKMGRRQQRIDERLHGGCRRRTRTFQRIELLARRREAGQDETQPSRERARFGRVRRCEARRFETTQDELVDRMRRPIRVSDLRRGGLSHRMQTPPIEPLLEDLLPRRVVRLFERLSHGSRCATSNPFGQVGHRRLGQSSLGRHLQLIAVVLDRLQQQTLLRLSGVDRRSRLTPATDAVGVVQPQFTTKFLRVGRVAFVTVRDEQRTDSFLEELQPRVIGRGGRSRQECYEYQCRVHRREGIDRPHVR